MPTASSLKGILADLKANNVGRASFLVGDLSAAQTDLSDLRNFQGYVGKALDFAQKIPAAYAKVFEMLLGKVFVFEDLPKALECFSQQKVAGATLVTLNGDVIRPNGLVTGGSKSEDNSGLIGRHVEIDQTKEDIAELALVLSQRQLDNQELKQKLLESKQQLIVVNNQIDEQLSSVNLEKSDLSKNELTLEHLQQDMRNLSKQRDELSEELGQAQSRVAVLLQKNAEMADQAQELGAKQEEKLEQLKKLEERLALEKQQLTAGQIELASMKERESSIKQRMEQNRRLREDEQRRLAEYRREIGSFGERKEALDAEIIELGQKMVECQQVRDELLAKLEQVKAEKSALNDQIQMKNASLKEIRSKLNVAQRAMKDQEVKIAEYEMKLGNLKARIQESYQMDWDTVLGFEREPLPDDFPVEERIEELKTKIGKLGPVNTEAISEYEELKTRFEFLNQQINDLTESKESLLKVISQINTESRKRFREAFEQINLNFQKLFKVLFKGGQAELKLLEGEGKDVLECGIEITACPPGKRPQSISLLSGGEKAMTGIALLFAMFKVKPSPFCVLDEIDAPLDDANIDRFIHITSQFKDKTQFVVITHSKKTMARADIIYGITMEKPGVSNTIAIKMVEYEQDKPQEEVPVLAEVS